MKSIKKIISLCLIIFMLIGLEGCKKEEEIIKENLTVKCYNGNFVGYHETETNVISFKGIPYAKAPVGELRWKAPVAVEESNETYDAKDYGYSSIQYYWFDEDIETEVSEDCLTLNIWTSDLFSKDKAVMVFIHGGAYAWGGSSEPIYNGQYIVDQHNDVVVVSINYRLGIMGFIDFSNVEGGENFPDSKELGLLDCIEALRWIKNNIESFGGDPDNVTIFGESAGGAIVCGLLASEYAGDLFDRVISESGSTALTYTEEQFDNTIQTETLLALSGCKNMDELMALTEEQLIAYNEQSLDEDGNTLNDLYTLPIRGGSVIALDSYEAIKLAGEKGVDLLIGTNADEQNFWIEEMGSDYIKNLSEEEILNNFYYFEYYYIAGLYDQALNIYTEEEIEMMNNYLSTLEGTDVERKSKYFTEVVYRMPALKTAEEHSKGNNGNTYLYLIEIQNTVLEQMGACHSIELPYVFYNLKDDDAGKVNKELAADICEAWVNFAKTGDPSSKEHKWEKFDCDNRKTMIIGNNGSFTIVEDPDLKMREALEFTLEKTLMADGA